eukprot:scpid64863/ scgid6448/ 
MEWFTQRLEKPENIAVVESKCGRDKHAFVRFSTLQKAVTASVQLDNKVFRTSPIRVELTHEFRDVVRYAEGNASLEDRKCSISARKMMTMFLEQYNCGEFDSYQDMVMHVAQVPVNPSAKYFPRRSLSVAGPKAFKMPDYLADVPESVLTDSRIAPTSPFKHPRRNGPTAKVPMSSPKAQRDASETSWVPPAMRGRDSL